MANLLTLLRIVLIIPFIALFYVGTGTAAWLTLAIFIIAGVTDFLDGYVARKFNQTSALGAALDPIADKLLTTAAIIMMIVAGKISDLHILAGLLIILREIWVAGLREALAGQASMPVSYLAKIKTTLQFVAIAILLAPLSDQITLLGLYALWGAALITVITGWQYTQIAFSHLRKS